MHRTQLIEIGLSSSAVARWEAGRRLHRLYPSVYAVGHRALNEEARFRAALLYAGPGAALSHLTAASWWELLDVDAGPIHLCVARRQRGAAGLVLHQPREVERTVHRGMAITTVPRTLLDIAAAIPLARVRRALAEAEFRRLVTVDEVARVLRRGRPGSRRLRRALALHQPELARTRSVLEERFLALCERYLIPPPEMNVIVCHVMVDALWRRERVVVELDGRAAHATAAALERDHRRDLALRTAGYVVLRYTWWQVTRQPALVAADVRRALNRELPHVVPA